MIDSTKNRPLNGFGKNNDFIIFYLDHPSAYWKAGGFTFTVNDLYLPIFKCRNNGCVVFQYLEGTLASGNLYQLDFSFKNLIIRCYDLKIHDLFGFFKHFITFRDRILNGANKVESSLRIFIHLSVHNHIKSLDGVLDRYEAARNAGKRLGNMEGL